MLVTIHERLYINSNNLQNSDYYVHGVLLPDSIWERGNYLKIVKHYLITIHMD